MANVMLSKPYSGTQSPSFALTPHTVTRCLAYFQYYTPKLAARGRFLTVDHLCSLARWIGKPMPAIRRLPDNLLLAGHLVMLRAGEFLTPAAGSLRPALGVSYWLNQPPADQIEKLIAILTAKERWQSVVCELKLQDTLTAAFSTYLAQDLNRQLETRWEEEKPATWREPQENIESDGWYLTLPLYLPTWLLFDLLQLGTWEPETNVLHCSPLSIASFPACAYGYEQIRWLLETATQAPLPADKKLLLRQWLNRAEAYRINGPLLSTSLPGHLEAVLADRQLRSYVLEQIGPRHALVNQAIRPRLRRWLAKRDYPLNQPAPWSESQDDILADPDPAYHWMGLRLQIGLQKRLRLPFPAPTEQLLALSRTLPAAALEDLERLAHQTLHELDNTDHGRDAFFPAWQCPTKQLVQQIEQALTLGRTITISYLSLGQREPKIHQVEPLRLERQDQLIYLHAYSYRAEANLTFRLDRVQNIES